MKDSTFNFEGYEVSYQVKGTGIPLLLVHGFAEDKEVWNNQLDVIKEFAQVIVVDLPGSGNSIKVDTVFSDTDNAKLSTIDFYVKMLFHLIQELKLTNIIMLGHSFGGYITLGFAEQHEELLSGFGLIHSTAYADSEEKKVNRQRGIELMEKYSGFSFLKTSIPNLFTGDFKKEHPEEVDALIERTKKFDTKTLQCYYRAMIARTDRTEVLKNTTKPVLIVAGEQDIAVPINDSLAQASIPAVCMIHIIKEAAHSSMFEAPEKLNFAIKEFINEVNR